jgi:hypothetical protein
MVSIQSGQSGTVEPTWPNFADSNQDASYQVPDNTVIWKFAVGSLLLRLRDNATTCCTRTPTGIRGGGTYTDDPLVGGSTSIKTVHIAELRTQLTDGLVALGFATPSFTDPTLTRGASIIKAKHVQELRGLTK